jgi:Protein of unknown function (DUF3293)
LRRAYRQTEYRAAGVAIRIGQRVPGAVFDAVDARVAVLVTAWNPQSRRMPDDWNRRMQLRLRERLRRFVAMDAAGSLRRWHEAMLLVGGNPRPVIRLAALFRQRGVVILRRNQRAQLWLLWPRASSAGKSRGVD